MPLSQGVRFLRIAREGDEKVRLRKLAHFLKIRQALLKPNHKQVNQILNLLGELDSEFHDQLRSSQTWRTSEEKSITFFNGIFHSYTALDTAALLTLLSTGYPHQGNSILRRIIEYLLYSMWLDLVAKFGYVFEFYWEARRWKPYIRNQRINKSLLKKKLKGLYQLNMKSGENFGRFKTRFFATANEVDFFSLLSFAICADCSKSGKYIAIPMTKEFPGDATDEVTNRFSTDFHEKCYRCGKVPKYIAIQFPEMDALQLMLRNFLKSSSKQLSYLYRVYNFLSNHFVHFSTGVFPWKGATAITSVGDRRLNLLGFRGAVFVFECLFSVVSEYLAVRKGLFRT